MSLPRLRLVVLPEFDLCQGFFFLVFGKSHQCRIPFHFLGEFLLPDQAAVIGVRQLGFVRAAVIAIPATAPFGVAFAGDAMTARATGGEIEKEKSLMPALVPALGLPDPDERGLNVIEDLF